MFDKEEYQALLTSQGEAVLADAAALIPREETYLPHLQVLRRRWPEHLARPALEIAILRRQAAESGKFFPAENLFFTRQALEQASSWRVAEYRAQRYRDLHYAIDLGCSIGGDLLALAKHISVLGIDLDPLRIWMAARNAASMRLSDRVHLALADLTHPLPFRNSGGREIGLFFDPARRDDNGRRFNDPEQYRPPLHFIQDWLQHFPAMGVKLSPAVPLDALDAYFHRNAELEFISVDGELKEGVLWFNAFATVRHRATLLPAGITLTGERNSPVLPLSSPQAYLYEPDPAVMRAGLVNILGWQIGAVQLDPDIAFLTTRELQHTALARVWQICDWMPFQLKRLRTYLRQHNIGRVTIKKRGSPLDPLQLEHALRLKGEEERVLVLSHLQGKPVVIICLPHPLGRH